MSSTHSPEQGTDVRTERPEDERLRDHVHVGLDIPIRVYKHPATDSDAEWWYYVDVELPNGESDCIGLVERREDDDGGAYWAGLSEPGYGTRCWEDSLQEAIDGLVRYALELDVKFRKELRKERIV